ncbi:hypothetical protein Poly51_13430 [Rubripirellula tenax]|uniref:Uncharacterized protein n=1 Tax=Rubripirellula tenax TaxID=2528015 RepID=A0A5C6FED9_9BACT|nr:GxxExxY protein [Rubripirellula tenax]TWU58564.1 hypothetical protein Poly51_13430 [Rubripirellula tenax]
MPVRCAHSIANLSTDEFGELDYRVMGHAFDMHNELGRLADERIYQADLAARIETTGMRTRREFKIQLSHQSFCKSLFVDFVVADRGVYELKAVKKITDAHLGQLLTYLLLLDLSHGKIIDFGSSEVESKFVNATLDSESRRAFRINASDYRGEDHFRDLVIELLRDWGTSLTLSLYIEAIEHLLGGNQVATAMLPLNRNGVPLGNQRFQLASSDTAFRLTAMKQGLDAFQKQLSRLVLHSPLQAIHWVNIAHALVTFRTIRRASCKVW